MGVMGVWLAKLAIRTVLGWVGLVVLTGGPLPRWMWRLIDEHEAALVAGAHDAGEGDGDGGRQGEPVLPADPTH